MAAEGKRVIALALDASDHAKEAFNYYVKYLHRPDDYLVLIHTPEMITPMSASPAIIDQLLREVTEKVDVLQTKYKELLDSSGIAGKFRTGRGKPGQVVVEIAGEEGASMILTGTRGMGTVRRTILGSVSDYIVHNSNVPVLVCKH